jgi:hypothetical protein
VTDGERKSVGREDEPGDFWLEVRFDTDSPRPERIFDSIRELIAACDALDHTFAESINATIQTTLVLHDVQASSIRVWLRTLLASIDDDALKELNWRKGVGAYLVKAKYRALDFLKDKTAITSRAELQNLQADLRQLAAETDVTHLPAYQPVSLPKLIHNFEAVETGLSHLTEKDAAFYETLEAKVELNPQFHIEPGTIERLLTRETIRNEVIALLKVKKPDYLGESMWQLVYEDRAIEAKIGDVAWLEKFQDRKVDVRPGDSIRAVLEITVHYGFENQIVARHYRILKVEAVVRLAKMEQPLLLDDSDKREAR